MIYQICDAIMSLSTWDTVHFWIYLLNCNSLTHQTWPIDRYKWGQCISEIFWTIWRTENKFQALFSIATCSNYSITNYVKFTMFHFFERVNKGELKIVNIKLLKFDRSRYFVISLKSYKSLELVSILQHWANIMLEMFILRYITIWQNLILTVLRIQKK